MCVHADRQPANMLNLLSVLQKGMFVPYCCWDLGISLASCSYLNLLSLLSHSEEMLQKDRFKLRYFVAAATDVTSLQKAETLGVPLLMRCCKRIVLHPYILLLLPLLLRVFRMLKYLRVPLLMRRREKTLE
ncbi:uncharacterized protein LOC141586466 [Silene latifolia]|uniref:uncharacterized protein LOC141586466 n=1 Tax=Silene latifolia TaxID=37657 RepID=UPI003D76D7FF